MKKQKPWIINPDDHLDQIRQKLELDSLTRTIKILQQMRRKLDAKIRRTNVRKKNFR